VTTLIGIGVIVLALGAILWRASKAGADEVKAKANEQAVKDIIEAVRPASDADLRRVQSKYRRD
jgi:type II secretory pathway pseudopilin PulG